MKGDFTRFTFTNAKNYISVLKQQGRVDLDSDWNEQTEIWRERFRQLTRDILGDFAVPLSPNDITLDNSNALRINEFTTGAGGVIDFTIGRGLAYVGGFPFILEKDVTFRTQPDYPEPEIPSGDGDVLIYIEVWEKGVNYIDDETIREPALGGPDTCLRSKLVGQVKAMVISGIDTPHSAYEFLTDSFRAADLLITLKIDQSAHQIPMSFGEVDLGGGLIPGNLHFRIELHRGIVANGGYSEGFKWSDENGATIVRVLEVLSNDTLLGEGAEAVMGESLKEGDLVEISNIITELHRKGGQMASIKKLTHNENGLAVTLDSNIHPLLTRTIISLGSGRKQNLAPRLRRWSGYKEPLSLKTVHNLGRGIKATFHSAGKRHTFRPGDFWTFAIRDRDYNKRFAPQKAPSRGVKIYRHPLAIIRRRGKAKGVEIIDCRRFFKPITTQGIT